MLTRIATMAIVCLVLNVLLIRVKDHMLNAAVNGNVSALDVIDIDGSMLARPKTNRTLPVKSQIAG